jgi:hypothetical protein
VRCYIACSSVSHFHGFHQSCGAIKDRDPEPFYTLSVEVSKKGTLERSLRDLVEGEVISDFLCDACEKRVDIVKRGCLSSLSNTVIVHLKVSV